MYLLSRSTNESREEQNDPVLNVMVLSPDFSEQDMPNDVEDAGYKIATAMVNSVRAKCG